MSSQDDKQYKLAITDVVNVRFYVHQQEDGRCHLYGQSIERHGTTQTFRLDPSSFDDINEARLSIVDQAKKLAACGFTYPDDGKDLEPAGGSK
jgi:hypothetical protein